MYARALANQFAREVRAGLARPGQKTLPCRYLYDDVGSALFDAITFLPEYGLTRADARILRRYSREIVGLLPQRLAIAELGSGSGSKTRDILEAQSRRQERVQYYPIDVSSTALARCARDLSSRASVYPVECSYVDGLAQVAGQRAPGQTLLILFLGSTIGNFESDAAAEFLCSLRRYLNPGDALLLGTDLVKPVDQLLAAYDDAAGVTAAFNLNLLGRINRDLEADFDLRAFEHMARYCRPERRIEMHLRSKTRQCVSIRLADLRVEFQAGETICTETCRKFQPSEIHQMAGKSGFRLEAQWTDHDWPFAESLLLAA